MLNVIGGRSLNSTRLYDELKGDIDPLAPENLLLIGVGPLTGTLMAAAAFMTISGKSPMTGILGDSAAGGHFGAEIKQAGYDQLVITGRSQKLCYLFIADDHVEIRDASYLWGQDIWRTTAAIRRELNDNAIQVAAIGPAGENLVKYAIVACNNSRTCGRTGTGLKFTPEKVDEALKDVIDRDRKMNIDFGVDAGQDTLPKRFIHEPLK
jgi:aldehyde:ferredoxin oxidoreductase